LEFLDVLESYKLQLLGQIYTLQMWLLLVKQFNFEFLINDTKEKIQLIIFFVHFHWAIIGVSSG